MKIHKNSLLFWYSKIKDLDIPQPKTKAVLLSEDQKGAWELNLSVELVGKCIKAIEELRYPVFFRTDQSSDKHNWKQACFIEKRDDIESHIYKTIEQNIIATPIGLPYQSLIFREYIPLESGFTAFFGELPIAKERRYFIKDRKVQCHHPYWPLESIRNPSKENWREILIKLNKETKEEINLLTEFCLLVSNKLEGYWSVDFAKGKDGNWYLIDMALGDSSFHHIDCKYCKEKMRNHYKEKIKQYKRSSRELKILESLNNNNNKTND